MDSRPPEPWQDRLSLIIPAFNEGQGIGPALAALRERLPRAEIIVVDDGSRDETPDVVAIHPSVRLIRHSFNRGYGAALKTGMQFAGRPYIAWFDADNEHRLDDVVAMVQKLESEGLSAVIGQRSTPGVSVRIAGKWLIRLLAHSLRFRAGKDLNCGLRVFRREAIVPYLPLLPNRYSASLTSTMLVVERGFPIAFHPIQLNARIGQSKVRMADGFSAALRVLQNIMVFAPLRIFSRLGFLFLLPGLAYSIGMAIHTGRGVPVGGVLLTVVGVLSLMLGLIADQIGQLRLTQLEAGIVFGTETSTEARPQPVSVLRRAPSEDEERRERTPETKDARGSGTA
jgi:glycosyltransferase involved in cell wall biosynthesis